MAARNPEYIWNLVKSFLKGGEDGQGTANLFGTGDKLSRIDRKLARAFLECTKRDMNASKLLYKEKDYPNAVYHLQQATEKLAKAYFMLFPLSSYSEIRQISHTTPKVFLQFLSKTWAKSLIYRLKSLLPSVDFGALDEVPGIMKTISKTQTQVEIARLSEEQIKEFLKITDSISPAKTELSFEAILRNQGMTIEEIGKVAQEILQNENVSGETYKGLDLKGLIRDAGDKMIRSVYFSVTLYVLAVITFPHERFTRYPDGDVKPAEYASSFGIVTQFEEIVYKLEEVFKHAESELLSDNLRHRNPSRRAM